MSPTDYREMIRAIAADMQPGGQGERCLRELSALVEGVREHDLVLAEKCGDLVTWLGELGELAKDRAAQLDGAEPLHTLVSRATRKLDPQARLRGAERGRANEPRTHRRREDER